MPLAEQGKNIFGVLVVLAITQVIAWGTVGLLAVVGRQVAADLQMDISAVFAGSSVLYVVMGLCAPFLAKPFARFGARQVMIAGTVIGAPGFVLLSLAHGPVLYFAAWAILGTAGSATLATATYIMLNEIAGRDARRAIGAMMLVTGLSSSIFWPTTSLLSSAVGWRGTCLVYAGMLVLVCLPLYVFGLPRRAERKDDIGPAQPSGESHIVRKSTFYLIVSATVLCAFVTFGLSATMIELLKAEGLSPAQAVTFGSMLGVIQVSARGLDFLGGGRWDGITTALIAATTLVAAILLLMIGGGSHWIIAAFILLYGLGSGALAVARATIPLVFYDNVEFAKAASRIAMPLNLISAASPPILVGLLANFGSNALLGLTTLCSSVALLMLYWLSRHRPKTLESGSLPTLSGSRSAFPPINPIFGYKSQFVLFSGFSAPRLPAQRAREHLAIREMTMGRIRALVLLGLCALAAQVLLPMRSNAQGIPQNIPRKELLILENPEGTIKNPGWFNIWAINAGSQSNGLQQAALDTLWYIDPDHGLDGVWDNSLAADKPQYNADFTEMTAKLRKGIFWSDGVEFTADDVIATVMTQIKNPGMRFSAVLASNVASVEAPDPYTVVFKLNKPNSRFHANFTVRWNAIWILPKHIFEKVADPSKFDFNKPVSLGAYVLQSYDPDGKWYIWQLRDDWQRTSLARFGTPGPKYLAYVDPGPPDKRVIAQLNHELDVIHDIAPEGMFALAKQSKSTVAWFKGFPYGHPDPTLPAVIFNDQLEMFKNKDVRWALALLIDIKAVSMASYRGAATISAIGVPPTGTHPETYHQPMEAWLKDFEIDTGKRKIKPYDPTVGKQIADMLRPSMGEQIPSDPKEIARAFGMGWWKPDPQAAQELLERAGYTKRNGAWLMPDGKPFTIRVMVEGDLRPVMTRAGTMIVQQWKQAGIDAKVDVAQGTLPTRRAAGDFDTFIGWSVETWGGHQDLSYFMDSWHSQFVAEPGKPQPARNWQRWASPALDKIIEQTRSVGFDDPKSIELGKDYVKLTVQEMPTIPLMAYNVFTAMDQTYWTGYPTAENPYTDPVPNWGNSRAMFVKLKPAK